MTYEKTTDSVTFARFSFLIKYIAYIPADEYTVFPVGKNKQTNAWQLLFCKGFFLKRQKERATFTGNVCRGRKMG